MRTERDLRRGRNTEARKSEDGTSDPRRALRRTVLPAHSVHTRRRVPNRKKKNPAPADSPIGAHRRQPTKQNMTDPRSATCMVHYSVREARVHMPSCWCSLGGPHGSRGACGVRRVTGDTDGAVLGTDGAVLGTYGAVLGVSPLDVSPATKMAPSWAHVAP
jgi:hypothetical protein